MNKLLSRGGMLACALTMTVACGETVAPLGANDAATGADVDAAGAADTELDAAVDAGDATTDIDIDIDVDAVLDPSAGHETLERVFATIGLDPESPTDLRRVWDEPDLFEAYLTAWGVERGVTFPREPGNKAECLHLSTFDPSVPYCGPGCGNNTTLAPPCLNRGCFEHDACYAAIECRSGQAIGLGLSFSSLTACCDAPLAPARDACGREVALGYLAGDISLIEAEVYNAVASIMVAVEASELFDSPTDRPPGTCDETFEQACGPGTLVLRAEPPSVGSGESVEVCATLTRSGRPVDVWAATPQPPSLGTWDDASAQGAGESEACLTWTAPDAIDDGDGPVELAVNAEVLGASIASSAESIELVPDDESEGCAEGFVAIDAGSFVMGSDLFVEPSTCSVEELRPATVAEDFCIQATEVTQRQWLEVMGTNPSLASECGDECPVENVTWHDAILFANALSEEEGFEPCYDTFGCSPSPGAECDGVSTVDALCEGYRLPTETEWEYAARAGSSEGTYGPVDEVAWYELNAGGSPRPVAMLAPNAWGLYDTLGNVAEYTAGMVTNPLGEAFPFEGCVTRSSNWNQPQTDVNVGLRVCIPCDGGRNGGLGLRLARSML